MEIKASLILDTVYEFTYKDPLAPGLLVQTEAIPNIILKVRSTQKQIEGAYTIRATRHEIINPAIMETIEIKKALESLGLKKQEIEIVLGCVKGVRVAPLAYAQLNDLTLEVVEGKAYREKVEGALGAIAGKAEVKPKAAPVRKQKAAQETPAPSMSVSSSDTVRDSDGPTDDQEEQPEQPKEKKKPTPRNNKKESAEEIKSNVADLGKPAPANVDL
jgi:hypothetical protein